MATRVFSSRKERKRNIHQTPKPKQEEDNDAVRVFVYAVGSAKMESKINRARNAAGKRESIRGPHQQRAARQAARHQPPSTTATLGRVKAEVAASRQVKPKHHFEVKVEPVDPTDRLEEGASIAVHPLRYSKRMLLLLPFGCYPLFVGRLWLIERKWHVFKTCFKSSSIWMIIAAFVHH